jgi:hypothetical protein
MYWIYMALDMDKIMYFKFHKRCGISVAERLLVSQELCSMESDS